MTLFWIIAGCLALSALFSGIEIAFVSSNKLHLELESQKGGPIGWALHRFIRRPNWFISSTLFSNTVMLTLYGIYIAAVLDPYLASNLPEALSGDFAILLFSTILSTLLVLFLGEFIPKSLFYINPEGLVRFFALPLSVFYTLISPFVQFTNFLARLFIVYILRQPFDEKVRGYHMTDLRNLVSSRSPSNGETHEDYEVDAQIFTNAIDFKGTRVRDCMVPRAEIKSVELHDSMEDLQQAFISSGHSKIIIFEEHIDEVVGYCPSSALFRKPESIQEIVQEITIVPESMLASALMMQFINDRKSIALVVDEFGGTSGIITIEDVFEEIFGEINDEHDTTHWVEQQLDHNTWLLSARHEIEYLNRKYNWAIPEGDYETLGGYILSVVEDIPETNSVVESEDFRFTIVSKEENRIDAVRMTVFNKEED